MSHLNNSTEEFLLKRSLENLSDEKLMAKINEQWNNRDFETLWYLVTHATTKPKCIVDTKKWITYLCSDGWGEVSSYMPQFIQGMNYFLNKQKIFTVPDVISLLQEKENTLFSHALLHCNPNDLKNFNDLRTKWGFEDYRDFHNQVLPTKNTAILEALYDNVRNIKSNNCEILRSYAASNFFDYDFIHKTIQKFDLDINSVGNIPGANAKGAFVHTVFGQHDLAGDEFFARFIKNYGTKINFDTLYTTSHGYQGDVLSYMSAQHAIAGNEQLNRYNLVLENCSLTEKNVSQIANTVMGEGFIWQFYNHTVYENLFKNPVFNSSFFDSSAVLKSILDFDHSQTIHNVRSNNKFTVNPTVILLNTFYNNTQCDNMKPHPFVYWAQGQNKTTYNATLPFLITKYKSDLGQFTAEDFEKIPHYISNDLRASGINVPEKPGFFSKLFGSKKADSPVVIAPIQEIKVVEELAFNTVLLDKVTDPDVKRYIESIQLNAEQYTVVFNHNIAYESEHYVKNLLPKFLNKTVENYLHFSTMDESEAKENVLVQLKLLNKKTFEVLNEGLQEEKEEVLRNGRIQNRILKQM